MSKLEILALCNYADYSKNGAFNIVGIFDQITPMSFPSSFLRAFIAFTISGNKPNSKFPASVKITDPNLKEVLNQSLELVVGGNGKANFLVEVVNLPLPKPGMYIISIEANGSKLGNTVFEVLDSKKDVK